MATLNMRELGAYIRDQRHGAQISMRQLAKLAGVSNPYLSQIERGMRKPSADILQQIAKGLRISAEALYVQAGILDERDDDGNVPAALLGDPHITERQKQVLVEIYESFRRENAAADSRATGDTGDTGDADGMGGTGAAAPDGTEPGAAEPAAPRPRRTAKTTAGTAGKTAAKAGSPRPRKRTAPPATERG
ncbi:MAG: helix-turn-helix domain-containing protein [Frankiaceae bacterium]